MKTNDTYMKFSWLTVTKKSVDKKHKCIVQHEHNKGGVGQEIIFPSVIEVLISIVTAVHPTKASPKDENKVSAIGSIEAYPTGQRVVTSMATTVGSTMAYTTKQSIVTSTATTVGSTKAYPTDTSKLTAISSTTASPTEQIVVTSMATTVGSTMAYTTEESIVTSTATTVGSTTAYMTEQSIVTTIASTTASPTAQGVVTATDSATASPKEECAPLQLQLTSTSAYYAYLLLLLASAVYFAIINFCLFRRTADCGNGKSLQQSVAQRSQLSTCLLRLFP
uniref:Uncharacterized protein n=1 Tax=Equus caballus TaxID=9796 RepID=A0A9L0RUX3_HORSE